MPVGFLDNCGFVAGSSGTGDFVDTSTLAGGYQRTAAAGAVNSTVYRYRAFSADQSQWEIGYGALNTGTSTLARTTVIKNSSGTTSKINFSAAPNVIITALADDILAAPLTTKIGLFAVNRPTAQTGLSIGNYTQIQLDTEEIDANGWYDNATNYRYTPLIAGWYWLYFGVQLVYTGSSAEAAVAGLFKNGTIAKQSGPMFVLGSGNCTLAAAEVGALIQMNGSSDYVDFRAYSGGGATASATAAFPARVFAGGWLAGV